MTPHDIIKYNSRHYECRACGQTWHSRPKTKCPQLKVYPNYHYLPLMTKEQLGYSGYQTSDQTLPQPTGCYYSPAVGTYVKLYDPAQAIKRQGRPRPRITTVVTDIVWPLKLLPILEIFSKFLGDRILYPDRSYAERINDMANIAAQFAVFAPDEIEQRAGPCIHLRISPSLTRHYYFSFQTNEQEQITLATHLAAAYERYKAGL